MPYQTLKTRYYAFFHSIISYGNIAWGGATKTALEILQKIQNRLVKIINKNNFVKDNPPNLIQIFAYECVSYHYNELKALYLTLETRTRNKFIIPPKCSKFVSDKNNYIKAFQIYNCLPKSNPNFKTLDITKNYNKTRIKKWISNNIFS